MLNLQKLAEMMQMRDRLFEVESELSAEEKRILALADRQLILRAAEFFLVSRSLAPPGNVGFEALPPLTNKVFSSEET
ncbi:MAG: hypothetical protein AB4352_27190 [Hormoscilla sp.]